MLMLLLIKNGNVRSPRIIQVPSIKKFLFFLRVKIFDLIIIDNDMIKFCHIEIRLSEFVNL